MSEQRTEKPTQQRIRKAREKGQFPAAKEFVSAAQFFVIAILLTSWFSGWMDQAKTGLRDSIAIAFRRELSPADYIQIGRSMIAGTFAPAIPAVAVIMAVTLALQVASTNMGVSFAKLAPSFARFNPASKFKEIGRANLPAALQALVVFAVVAYYAWNIGEEHLPVLLTLPMGSLDSGLSIIGEALTQVLWRSTAILAVVGAIEMFRHRWLYNKDLAMTKQEIRDEFKHQEGDPNIKGRLKQLRRQLLRRQMIKDVETATAVVVNPTHFAVAIRYDSDTMASPRVVAKGKNYLALRIKQRATEHLVPIVENPPLARALYQSVEVGQEIPSNFFRAVAEILAYVYRMTGARRPGA